MGLPPSGWNDVLVLNGIKPRIQRDGRAHPLKVERLSEADQPGQGFGENDAVIAVDGFDTDGASDEAVILVSGDLFFPFLMLVPRVHEAIPPFLTTVLLPSPFTP